MPGDVLDLPGVPEFGVCFLIASHFIIKKATALKLCIDDEGIIGD